MFRSRLRNNRTMTAKWAYLENAAVSLLRILCHKSVSITIYVTKPENEDGFSIIYDTSSITLANTVSVEYL